MTNAAPASKDIAATPVDGSISGTIETSAAIATAAVTAPSDIILRILSIYLLPGSIIPSLQETDE
jgi:hypothetical protein